MLDIARVIKSKPGVPKSQPLAELPTPWGEALDPRSVLPEHPNPQFARTAFIVLNGTWSYAIRPAAEAGAKGKTASGAERPSLPDPSLPETWDGEIIVPFSPGTLLSGVPRILQPDEELWYRHTFALDTAGAGRADGGRVLLHFQAVDHACTCWVDGTLVGVHTGGYTPFTFDITDALSAEADTHDIVVRVTDPTDAGTQPRGKQKLAPGGIWYTPTSGIWQTVWMETVPAAHLTGARLQTDPDAGTLTVTAKARGIGGGLQVRLLDRGREVAAGSTEFTSVPDAALDALPGFRAEAVDVFTVTLSLDPADMHLWSPDDPFLYDVELSFGDDRVASYCAFRTAAVEDDGTGRRRFCLNHKPLFLKGVLDQGYWSDGGMTAPADAALVYDIEAMKALGFNLLRKHIKVESARWYYHCDRLGMLVMQDMVSGGGPLDMFYISTLPTLCSFSWTHYNDSYPSHQRHLSASDQMYRIEWRRLAIETILRLGGHPSIVSWCLFNEGWGQFSAQTAAEHTRKLDPSRVIDATSGWFDQRCGDFLSEHNYFRGDEVYRRGLRKAAATGRGYLVSEFGGLSLAVAGHEAARESYGYGDYESPDSWRAQVRALLDEVERFADKGLSGYVYTQLSDVEEENNGILTYDRKVNKLDPSGGASVKPTDGEARGAGDVSADGAGDVAADGAGGVSADEAEKPGEAERPGETGGMGADEAERPGETGTTDATEGEPQ